MSPKFRRSLSLSLSLLLLVFFSVSSLSCLFACLSIKLETGSWTVVLLRANLGYEYKQSE